MLTNKTSTVFGVVLPLLVLGLGARALFHVDTEVRPVATAQDGEAEEGDEPITIAQLPAAVAKTAAPYVRSLEACKASREVDEGHVVFEVNGVDALGNAISLKLADDGSMLEVERKVAAAALPAAARKALAARFPGATTESAESVELHFFEIKLTHGGEQTEVKLAADGSFLDDGSAEEGEHAEKGKQAKKSKKEKDEDEDEDDD